MFRRKKEPVNPQEELSKLWIKAKEYFQNPEFSSPTHESNLFLITHQIYQEILTFSDSLVEYVGHSMRSQHYVFKGTKYTFYVPYSVILGEDFPIIRVKHNSRTERSRARFLQGLSNNLLNRLDEKLDWKPLPLADKIELLESVGESDIEEWEYFAIPKYWLLNQIISTRGSLDGLANILDLSSVELEA